MRDRKPGKLGSGVWSAIGSWTGTPLRDFLKLVGADTRAKYVWFQCARQGRLQLAS
jgi:DMSO/TMAO reductase YedYZ molybdopterin-dependent catalytic subunit